MPEEPIELFYSYAHADETMRKKLEDHLSLLRREGYIGEWHDRMISPGSLWGQEIDAHLKAARIIPQPFSPQIPLRACLQHVFATAAMKFIRVDDFLEGE